MAASDLAQLADVKFWLAGSSGIGAGDDPILSRLITDVSGAIYAYLSRPWLIPQQVTERYDGDGKRRLYLRRFPVVSIASLVVDGVSIPAAATPGAGVSWPQAGFLVEPWDGVPPGGIQAIDCFGDWSFGGINSFRPGRQNVQVTYTAGYQVTGEPGTVPALPGPYTITPAQPYGPWASDQAVTYANGTPLAKVATNPAQGQYAATLNQSQDASPPTWSIAYQFNAADAGAAVLISYGFIPASINNACIEWAAERYRYRKHIGQSSETVAGQMTTAYSLKGVPDFIRASLDPYVAVVPA